MTKGNARIVKLTAIVLPPLLLGIVGLFHPHHLTPETAERWILVHIILLPLFPLLGLSYFLVLSQYRGWPISLAKICTGIYAVFYTALDTIAGIANGVVVARLGNMPEVAKRAELITELRESLYTMGNLIGNIGIYALVVIAFLMYVSFTKMNLDLKNTLALMGFVAGTGLFAIYHLYAPWGIVAMFALAASMLSFELTGKNATPDKK